MLFNSHQINSLLLLEIAQSDKDSRSKAVRKKYNQLMNKHSFVPSASTFTILVSSLFDSPTRSYAEYYSDTSIRYNIGYSPSCILALLRVFLNFGGKQDVLFIVDRLKYMEFSGYNESEMNLVWTRFLKLLLESNSKIKEDDMEVVCLELKYRIPYTLENMVLLYRCARSIKEYETVEEIKRNFRDANLDFNELGE
jgi:hypothetical protein